MSDLPAGSVGQHQPRADPASYEQARDELTDVVQRLEAGGLGLEESLALWERGERLAALCQEWLDGARARLDKVIAGHQQSSEHPGPG
jgi:exodeoxyribonuclease VII small subunit